MNEKAVGVGVVLFNRFLVVAIIIETENHMPVRQKEAVSTK